MTRIQGIVPILITVLTALLTIGCATGNDNQGNLRGGYEQIADAELHPMQLRLVEAAHWAEGRNDVSCDGRSFAMDCSGVVSAVYWKAGIDLQAAYPLYTGNGVTRIYRYLDDKRLLYRPDEPAPGDIIFWDNSYDKNDNGRADDDLTHLGMVVSVSPSGDVTYIHHDYISGVIFANMYPPDPSDRSRNSGMRMQSLGPTPDGKTTSGDLYRKAGRGWELEPSG
jgi:hypothetical protein